MHGFRRPSISRNSGRRWTLLLPLLLATALVCAFSMYTWGQGIHHGSQAMRLPTVSDHDRSLVGSSKDVNRNGSSSSILANGNIPPWLPLKRLQQIAAQVFSRRTSRAKRVLPAKSYQIPPEPRDMRAQHLKVKTYLKSPAFPEAVAARKRGPPRGIIINGGGRKVLSSAVVLLKVLREVHKCTLPVELVWHTPEEMDNSTLATLQRRFGPLRGYRVLDMPWPDHQRQHRSAAAETAAKDFLRFERKVRSLYYSRFASALLLDADNVPLVHPESFWEEPEYVQHGSLFWPDFWAGTAKKDLFYDTVGLEQKPAVQALEAGKGGLRRDTESGAVVLDLVRHADVLEWLLWINSWPEIIYKMVWGDKDTFPAAFAVAGKAEHFTQVQVPPGAGFAWRPNMLLVKKTQKREAGWQLGAMVQYNSRGAPVFVHRTINKFWYTGEAWELERLTAPLPLRWVRYYLDQQSLGPTVGVPYDFVVPDSALATWAVNPQMRLATAAGERWEVRPIEPACPVVSFLDYWRMRELGLPLGVPADPALLPACMPLLYRMMGPEVAAAYSAAGLSTAPETATVAGTQWDAEVWRNNPAELSDTREEVGDGTPVAAWHPQYFTPTMETKVTQVLRASHEAFRWLAVHVEEFSIIKKGP